MSFCHEFLAYMTCSYLFFDTLSIFNYTAYFGEINPDISICLDEVSQDQKGYFTSFPLLEES